VETLRSEEPRPQHTHCPLTPVRGRLPCVPSCPRRPLSSRPPLVLCPASGRSPSSAFLCVPRHSGRIGTRTSNQDLSPQDDQNLPATGERCGVRKPWSGGGKSVRLAWEIVTGADRRFPGHRVMSTAHSTGVPTELGRTRRQNPRHRRHGTGFLFDLEGAADASSVPTELRIWQPPIVSLESLSKRVRRLLVFCIEARILDGRKPLAQCLDCQGRLQAPQRNSPACRRDMTSKCTRSHGLNESPYKCDEFVVGDS
jgi:hypothetical protein